MKRKHLEKALLTQIIVCIVRGEGDGKIVLIEASPKGWNPIGQFVIQPQTQKETQKVAFGPIR